SPAARRDHRILVREQSWTPRKALARVRTGIRSYCRWQWLVRQVCIEGRHMLEAIVAFATLTAMEIVLGIDNIIFIAIVAGRLPPHQQPRARRLGLAAALITRLLLLATLSYILKLDEPLFTLPALPLFHELEARAISVRDLILIGGGLFLIAKSTVEIHERLSDEEPDGGQ